MNRITLAIVDDHRMLLGALTEWIRGAAADIEMVAAVPTWPELITHPTFPVQVVLLDVAYVNDTAVIRRNPKVTAINSAIEVDLTPNRSDCLCVAGVAREVGVLFQQPVRGVAVEPVPPVIPDTFPVELEAPADCPRYVGRVVRNVDPAAQTPLWMKERLRRMTPEERRAWLKAQARPAD